MADFGWLSHNVYNRLGSMAPEGAISGTMDVPRTTVSLATFRAAACFPCLNDRRGCG